MTSKKDIQSNKRLFYLSYWTLRNGTVLVLGKMILPNKQGII